ncbi:DMT family transporter [Halodurantibacterium flavum]|uniref:DMT family transporter n=1 Tax=Halodurantibacterium flavum TaxID=1382802 RepID=A0ABW4S613_9RHOB
MTGTDRILPGVMLMLGFCLTAPLIDVASKLAAATVPAGQITLARFVVQALLMLPVVLLMGLPMGAGPRALWLLFWRAAFSILATFFFVAAVAVMPIADALAIVFVEPFIILLLGWLIFGEEVGPRRLGASVIGFAGCLLVIQPSFAVFGAVAFYPLGTALFFALYMLATRRLSQVMHPVTMQLHTAVMAVVLCLPLLLAGHLGGVAALSLVLPAGIAWTWLGAVGVAATVSHMLITYALRFAPSATLAPLHYLELVSAVGLGYLVFGDFPDPLTWVGIAVIAGSGLYIIHRERSLQRHRPLSVPPLSAPEAPPAGSRAAE